MLLPFSPVPLQVSWDTTQMPSFRVCAMRGRVTAARRLFTRVASRGLKESDGHSGGEEAWTVMNEEEGSVN